MERKTVTHNGGIKHPSGLAREWLSGRKRFEINLLPAMVGGDVVFTDYEPASRKR